MITKNISINDDLSIELRKEDGCPQIRLNTNCLDICIGTHEDLTPNKLREIADALIELADNISPIFNIKEEKCFYVKNKKNQYIKLNQGNYQSCSDTYYENEMTSDEADLFISKAPHEYKKFIKVNMFPRSIGNIKYPLDLIVKSTVYDVSYSFFASLPKDILKEYNIYTDVLEYIKKYNGGSWDWILQSSQLTLFKEVK